MEMERSHFQPWGTFKKAGKGKENCREGKNLGEGQKENDGRRRRRNDKNEIIPRKVEGKGRKKKKEEGSRRNW